MSRQRQVVSSTGHFIDYVKAWGQHCAGNIGLGLTEHCRGWNDQASMLWNFFLCRWCCWKKSFGCLSETRFIWSVWHLRDRAEQCMMLCSVRLLPCLANVKPTWTNLSQTNNRSCFFATSAMKTKSFIALMPLDQTTWRLHACQCPLRGNEWETASEGRLGNVYRTQALDQLLDESSVASLLH